MTFKIFSFDNNENFGVTNVERKIASSYLFHDGEILKTYAAMFFKEMPIHLVVPPVNNLHNVLLENLKDLECPLVIEFLPKTPVMQRFRYISECQFTLESIAKMAETAKWPYALILGLPLDICRDFIHASYRIDTVVDLMSLSGEVDPGQYFTKPDAEITCIHQKAILK